MHEYKISVIVPVYNVEAYLDECIDSLINQTYKNFEVIFINDGSTDSSRVIIEDYCKKFSNFKIINQENSGSAGGPRNKGIKESTGEYIFFLDPDDKLPYTALERLLLAANKSNSEVVCGSYINIKGNKSWAVKHVMKSIFTEERITSFKESKELIKNLIVWNKLYRSDFIKSNNILFDEVARYGEDREFALQTYLLADKIHIIKECVYYYRIRLSTSNVSAVQTYKIETFNESITACKKDLELLNKYNSNYTLNELYGKERIGHDFIRFIDYYAKNKTSDEEWNEIIDISNEYMNLVDGKFDNATYIQRRKIKYIQENDIEGLIKYTKLRRNIFKIYKLNDEVTIKDYNLELKEMGKHNHLVNSSDLNPFYKIENIKIQNKLLKLRGWAYIHRFMDSTKNSLIKSLIIEGEKGECEFKLDSKIRLDVLLKKGKGIYDYRYSGFDASIDLNKISNLVTKKNSIVRIYLKLKINDDLFEQRCIQKLYIYNYLNDINEFNKIKQRVEKINLCDDHITMQGWAFIDNYSYTEEDKKQLIFVNRSNKNEKSFELQSYPCEWCNSTFDVNPYNNNYAYPQWLIDIPYYELQEGVYDLYIQVENGEHVVRDKLRYSSINLMKKYSILEYGKILYGRRLRFELSNNEVNREYCEFLLTVEKIDIKNLMQSGGISQLIGAKSDYYDTHFEKEDLLLKRIAVTSKELEFWGTYINKDNNVNKSLLLEDEYGKEYEFNSEEYDFYIKENLNIGWVGNIKYKLPAGKYKIKFKIVNDNNESFIIDEFRMNKNLEKNKKVWDVSHYIRSNKVNFKKSKQIDSELYELEFCLDKSLKNLIHGIVLKVSKRLKKIINKSIKLKSLKKNKVQIRTSIYLKLYKLFKVLPIHKNRITLVSYKEDMPVDYFNFCKLIKKEYKNIDIKFIGGNSKTLREYFHMAYRFATSSNILIDSYYRHLYNVDHRRKTKFIQVWHATGIFKRFALLAVGKNQANSEEFEKNAHHYYTNVIVSGKDVVKPYAEAFGLEESKVQPLGVSRTDDLFDEDKKKDIIKDLYEIYPQFKNKKVILYAPTFRGDDNERKKFRNQLDFSKMSNLKKDGYILVVKLHPNVKEPLEIPDEFKDFVYDLSKYPSINNLFYITDILITDYSSSIFEFSLLKKPMIFFAYDLDKYLDERGFYYDYEEFVPGTICRETEEVVNCISNINKDYYDYDKFINKYMSGCDGHATQRLVDLVMNKRGK